MKEKDMLYRKECIAKDCEGMTFWIYAIADKIIIICTKCGESQGLS